MRILDAITRPAVLATVGAVALTAATTIAIVGTSAPARESFGCRLPVAHHSDPPPPPPAPRRVEDARPLPQVSL